MFANLTNYISSYTQGIKNWAEKNAQVAEIEWAEQSFPEFAKWRKNPYLGSISNKREELEIFQKTGAYGFWSWAETLPACEKQYILASQEEFSSFLAVLQDDEKASFFSLFKETYEEIQLLSPKKRVPLKLFIVLYNKVCTSTENFELFKDYLTGLLQQKKEEDLLNLKKLLEENPELLEEEDSSFKGLSQKIVKAGAWKVFTAAQKISKFLPSFSEKELSVQEQEEIEQELETTLSKEPSSIEKIELNPVIEQAVLKTAKVVNEVGQATVSTLANTRIGKTALSKGSDLMAPLYEKPLKIIEEIFAKRVVRRGEELPSGVFKLKQDLVKVSTPEKFLRHPIDFVITIIVNFVKKLLSLNVFQLVDNLVDTILDPEITQIFLGKSLQKLQKVADLYEKGNIPVVTDQEKKELLQNISATLRDSPNLQENLSRLGRASLRIGVDKLDVANKLFNMIFSMTEEPIRNLVAKEGETEENIQALQKALTCEVLQALQGCLMEEKDPSQEATFLQNQFVEVIQRFYSKQVQKVLTEGLKTEEREAIATLSTDFIKTDLFKALFNKTIRIPEHLKNLSAQLKISITGIKPEKVSLSERVIKQVRGILNKWKLIQIEEEAALHSDWNIVSPHAGNPQGPISP